MTIERLIKASSMGWTLIDDDCFQWQRGILDRHRLFVPHYEMCQILKIGDKYRVCHGTVAINDTSYEELEVLVKRFGYKNLDDFVLQTANSTEFIFNEDGTIDRIHSPSWILEWALLAQMDFKTNAIDAYLTNVAFDYEDEAEEYIYREFLCQKACVW